MALEISELKRQIQDHLQEGLLLVVGTGLSTAEGIPGMGPLAEHLKTEIPTKLGHATDPAWNQVVAALDSGDNLEAAMGKATLQPMTVDAIVTTTAALISIAERKVFERVLAGTTVLPFTTFV